MERAVQTRTQSFTHNLAPFQFKFQNSNCTLCCLPPPTNRPRRTIHSTMADSSSKKRPRQLQTFDLVTKKSHNTAVKLLDKIYLDHMIANNGKYKQNFVKGLINQAQNSASSLNITQHNIRHEVVKNQRQREQREVSSSLISLTKSNESLSPAVRPATGFNVLGSAAEVHGQAASASAAVSMTVAMTDLKIATATRTLRHRSWMRKGMKRLCKVTNSTHLAARTMRYFPPDKRKSL